jgi:hypothetical protein
MTVKKRPEERRATDTHISKIWFASDDTELLEDILEDGAVQGGARRSDVARAKEIRDTRGKGTRRRRSKVNSIAHSSHIILE